MNDLFRTLLTGGTVVGLTGTLAPVASLLSLREPARADPVIRFWADRILAAAGVEVSVEGLERLPPQGQFVLALNHQSNFDVLVVLTRIPRHLRFVAKAELFKVPVFGFALRRTGNVSVSRHHREQDRTQLHYAAEAVRQRVSIAVFPEGTRSEDGALLPFKRGAALLAIEAQVPLVPAAIAGTRHVLPKQGTWIHGGQKVALVVGEPLETRGLAMQDREPLTRRLRGEVARLLDEAEALVAPEGGEPAR